MNQRRQMSGEEREYWHAVKGALQWYCRDNQIDKLDSRVATDLRHGFHRAFLEGADRSHVEFDHDDYSVAIAWLRAYAHGGLIVAAFVNLAEVREQSKRARYFWIIDKKMGRAYCEPMARGALHLTDDETLDWSTVPTHVLFEITRVSNTRYRSKHKPEDQQGVPLSRGDGIAETESVEDGARSASERD